MERKQIDHNNNAALHHHDHQQHDEGLVLKLPVVVGRNGSSPASNYQSTFDLQKAVCNHGFFMMAPNVWEPSTKTLSRPLRLADSVSSLHVSISQPSSNGTTPPFLNVHVHGYDCADQLSSADRQAILKQVARMLRISEKDERDVTEFQQMHYEAKEKGFGRLFRSPSLFEDAVKAILLCFCPWKRSLEMAQALCNLQLELDAHNYSNPHYSSKCKPKAEKSATPKRKKQSENVAVLAQVNNKRVKCASKYSSSQDNIALMGGNFPSATELACLSKDVLEEKCNLGFRARTVLEIARKVESGKIKLDQIEMATTCEEAYKRVMKIGGFGDFASATLLICIGFYHKVPLDTETIRHLKEVHGIEKCSKGNLTENIKKIYDKYAPFQSLAYWLELQQYYESKFGKLNELPRSLYHTVTGSYQLSKEANN